MIRPEAQLQAGHRPSELIPPGVHPARVTIVVVTGAHRPHLGPTLLILAAAVGTAGVVVAICAMLQLAAATATAVAAAAPTLGGASLTLKLARKGK